MLEIWFELCWQQQGGSGLNVSFADLDGLRLPDILWLVDRGRRQRQAEADAIQKSVKQTRAPRKR